MIKILWADDQQDVVNSFSLLLKPLNPEIDFVSDGETALKKIIINHYNVLLLDLMMPPNEWGGLWLLEQIKALNLYLPIIILSGEGTQEETIKALRLGANDYVTKDKVQKELLITVEKVLAVNYTEITQIFIANSASLLSIPYKRYISCNDPNQQLKRAFEFFESFLRFCSLVGISELKYFDNSKINSYEERLKKGPTMGSWNSIRIQLSGLLPPDSFFCPLNKCVDDQDVSFAIEKRNDIAHGSEPSKKIAKEILEELSTSLFSIIEKVVCLVYFNLVFINNMQLLDEGSNYSFEGHYLKGDSISLPKFSGELAEPLVANRLYIISPNKKPLLLHPFIIVEDSDIPSSWRILIYDRFDRRLDPNNLLYIDLWSGTRNIRIEGYDNKLFDNYFRT